MKKILIAASAAFLLAACGEVDQSRTGVRTDTAAFQGTNMPNTAQGWKPGDKNSWQQELKTRTQRGQNEYTRVH